MLIIFAGFVVISMLLVPFAFFKSLLFKFRLIFAANKTKQIIL